MNLRSPKAPDLQSGAIDRSATPPHPKNYGHRNKRDFAFQVKYAILPDMGNDRKNTKKPYKQSRNRGFDKKGDKRGDRFEKPQRPQHAPAPSGEKPSLYGTHAVREAWLNPARKIKALYLTDQAAAGFEETVLEARQKGLKRPAPVSIDKNSLEKMLPPGAVHQGLGLVCDPLDEVGVQDLMIRTADMEAPVLVILDQVTDPHNVGAILRSACAFGVQGVIMQRRHAPEMDGVLAKTACGAAEYVPVAYETNLSRAIEELKEGGYFVIGLDERGGKSIAEFTRGSKKGKTVLVLGAEGPGIRRLVSEHCDELVHIPMTNNMASINVSNAAAVALYALIA